MGVICSFVDEKYKITFLLVVEIAEARIQEHGELTNKTKIVCRELIVN